MRDEKCLVGIDLGIRKSIRMIYNRLIIPPPKVSAGNGQKRKFKEFLDSRHKL